MHTIPHFFIRRIYKYEDCFLILKNGKIWIIRKCDKMKEIDIVCGIIKTEKGYVIGQRKSDVHDGMWEFPGGKVEAQETKEEALIREFQEELGIEIKVLNALCSIQDVRKDCILHVHAYICEWVKNDMQLHAHHKLCFVEAKDLYQYAFEDADKEILDAVNTWERRKEHEENRGKKSIT